MDPLEEAYEQVARGEARPPAEYNEYKRMLARARGALKSQTVQDRLDAVAVCGAIGGFRGMDVVRQFLRDPERTVRQACVEQAVASGEDGLSVLREALGDKDDDLALEAARWVERAMDKGAVSKVRSWLRHDNPQRRAAAARLMGQLGGAGMVVQLRRLLEDADETVQSDAQLAIDRIEGRAPRAEPDLWWLEDAPEPGAPWTPPERLALPTPLPTDILALFRLLARVAPADEAAVAEALQAVPSGKVGMVARKATSGSEDVDYCVGVARLLAHSGRSDLVVPVRRLLPHEDVGVRIAVLDALGGTGMNSVVNGVRDGLTAVEPQVRVAAVQAMARLVSGKELAGYLAVLADDADERVRAAVEAASA